MLTFLLILLWAKSVSVEDMYKQMFLLLRVLEHNRPARVQLELFASTKARPNTLRNWRVLASNAFPGIPSRESVQGLVKTCLEMCDLTEVYPLAIFNKRSMQLGLSTGVAAELEIDWNLDT